MHASPLIISCVVLYLVGVLCVGLYLTKKKVKNSDDFAVANRSLPTIVLIGTLLATWCGAGGITGSANLIWRNGPLFGILIFMGAPIGMLLLYLVSGRVREATTYTIPELFEIRYGTAARVIATVCIVLGYVGILSSQFTAAGSLINLTTGVDLNTAVIVSGLILIMLILAVTGGMVSVAYTDAIGAFLFVGGFLVAIPILSGQVDGGFFGVFANLPEGRNSFIGSLNFVQALGYIFPIFFLVLGDQNMIQRMGAAKDVKTAKQSGLGLVISEIVVCALIITLTTTGIYLLPNIDRPDTVIFQLAINFLPPLFGGILMAACMSFIITTRADDSLERHLRHLAPLLPPRRDRPREAHDAARLSRRDIRARLRHGAFLPRHSLRPDVRLLDVRRFGHSGARMRAFRQERDEGGRRLRHPCGRSRPSA